MILRKNVWFNEKRYDLPLKCIIYREKLWINEKMYDLTRKCMIYQENIMIYREIYDLLRKCHDLSRNVMIYQKKVLFTEKMSWFTEKMSWFTDYSYDFSKILFYCIYNFFNVFLIHMCIFFQWDNWDTVNNKLWWTLGRKYIPRWWCRDNFGGYQFEVWRFVLKGAWNGWGWL